MIQIVLDCGCVCQRPSVAGEEDNGEREIPLLMASRESWRTITGRNGWRVARTGVVMQGRLGRGC